MPQHEMLPEACYRVSLKAFIFDDDEKLLFVREGDSEDLSIPGGGMDHGEDIKTAMKRELYEEIGYEGDMEMEYVTTITKMFKSGAWYMQIIFRVTLDHATVTADGGEHAQYTQWLDADEVDALVADGHTMLGDAIAVFRSQ